MTKIQMTKTSPPPLISPSGGTGSGGSRMDKCGAKIAFHFTSKALAVKSDSGLGGGGDAPTKDHPVIQNSVFDIRYSFLSSLKDQESWV
jgi:hypothetical protein